MYSLSLRAHWERSFDLIHCTANAEITFVFSSYRTPHAPVTHAAGP